jgi:nucleotide-binding universal stress UspA family protein
LNIRSSHTASQSDNHFTVLEAVVINHILVPLDGSELAECVLPHLIAIAPVTGARVTLIHVLERALSRNGNAVPIDPLTWHMQKQESQSYLDRIAEHLKKLDLQVEQAILEGNPAETLIEYARNNAIDLLVLSTHGRTGLSEWNVSSVVQKILLRSYKSILLIRAYASPPEEVQYNRLFLAIDGSMRAEYILPFAMSLAQSHHSNVILGMVIQPPQALQRFPLSEEDAACIYQFTEKCQTEASRYLDQLATQLSLKGVSAEVKTAVSENALGAVYDMAEDSNADLIMIAAHGYSGERRWPYGSIAASLIAYGRTPLMIMQDLSESQIPQTHAERAIREVKGR